MCKNKVFFFTYAYVQPKYEQVYLSFLERFFFSNKSKIYFLVKDNLIIRIFHSFHKYF